MSSVKTPISFDSETNEEEKVIKWLYICLLNYFFTLLMPFKRKPQMSYQVSCIFLLLPTLCRISQVCAESVGLLWLHRVNQWCCVPIRWLFLTFEYFWSPVILDSLMYSKNRKVPKLHAASTMYEPHSESHYGQYTCVHILSGHV